LATIILDNCVKYKVSPNLAFAVAQTESDFNARLVSHNKASVDRGLFQLNSKTFPNYDESDFFDVSFNAAKGIAHLRACLDLGGTDEAGVAIYNAGLRRVEIQMTPPSTYRYVIKIATFAEELRRDFDLEVVQRVLPRSN
jgi:soluble lytic murein transglycosylase-like protein